MAMGTDRRYRKHARSWNQWAYWDDAGIVDPDFDDESEHYALLAYEIATSGVVPLHPDGDRRSADDDPVPLCSHVPDGDNNFSEFPSVGLQLRRAQEHYERLAAEQAEQDRKDKDREAARILAAERELVRTENERLARQEQRHQERLAALEYHYPTVPVLTEEEEVMLNMRLNEPVRAHCGRVWRNYVMINESDEGNANPESTVEWTEFLRCRGFIIYRRRVIGDVYIANAM